MNKKLFKTALFSAIFGVSIFLGTNALAFQHDLRKAAANCEYNGDMSTHCNASDGTNNLWVLRCEPGETNCYY